MRKQLFFGILILCVHFGASVPVDEEKDTSSSPGVEAKEKEGTETLLETSNSEKDEKTSEVEKVKTEDGSSASAEKLGTSSTVPVGYATANGIVYDAPLTSGDYSAFGKQPHLYVQQGHQQGHQGQHIQPALHHGHNQVLVQGGHAGGFDPAQYQHGHGHGHGAVIQEGVAYAGHGQQAHHGLPVGHEQHQLAGVGGPAFAHGSKGQFVQTGVEAVPGSHSLHKPYNPYGNHHGGVIYMGNGLVPEHVAGVKLAGPVVPPAGYRQQEIIQKGSEVDALGNVHSSGVALKSSHGLGYNPHHGGIQQAYHVQQVHQQNVPGFPPQVSLNTASRVKGYDDYGNVVQDLKIKQRFENGPGLGYNGLQNDVIAHTDEAFVGHRRHHGPRHHYDGRGFSNPDPYYNNEPLPHYQRGPGIGHATTLLTTGPHKYYQGKNPVGVYERYHRLG